MNPIKLFSQFFGKSVPFLMIPIFTFHFYIKHDETKNVMLSLQYAARKTLIGF